MTEHDAKGLTRRGFLECSVGVAVTVGVLPACGSGDEKAADGDANAAGTGGNQTTNSGQGGSGTGQGGSTSTRGGSATGGTSSSNGGSTATGGSGNGGSGNGGAGNGGAGNGGASTEGGANASGGSTGGQTASGGSVSTGGKANTGGSTTGGSATGGSATGGKAGTGGTGTGGKSNTGGAGTGGNATGGKSSTGGASTGGSATTGGTTPTGGTAPTGGTTGTGGSTSTGSALVGIVRNANVATAVANAVAIAGGIPSLTGKTVMIKPNVVWSLTSPYVTSPGVVAALINMVRAQGATRVIVADRSDGNHDTAAAFRESGIAAVVSQAGAELLDLGTGTFTVVRPTGATNWENGISYSNFVRSGIDYLINVPCCKHHSMAGFTAAIKNWMGIIEQEGPGLNCGRSWAHGQVNMRDLGLRLPELHLGIRENLVVMDATQILLTRGPFEPGGEVAAPGIIVASKDPVAVDVVAMCLLKHYLKVGSITNGDIDPYTPWTQPQIVRALQIGMQLGGWIKSKADFNYSAQGVSEISTIMGYLNA